MTFPTFTETLPATGPRNSIYADGGYARLVDVTVELWDDYGHVTAQDFNGNVWVLDTKVGETEQANAQLLINRGYTTDACILFKGSAA